MNGNLDLLTPGMHIFEYAISFTHPYYIVYSNLLLLSFLFLVLL